MKNRNLIIIIILSIISVIFVYNDDFLYKKEIIKITKINTIKEEISQNSLGLKERIYTRKITGVVTNGKNKGKIKSFNYEETFSSVTTDRYKIHDKVFINSGGIDGLKRDFYVVALLFAFIISIFIVGKYKGLLSILSVIINIIIFYLGLYFYFRGINILILCIIESILFSILSLIIAGGINKKTMSAIVSVILSTVVLLLLILVVATTTNYSGINFNELSFLTVPPEDIIIPELLIGSIGAIMDVAITISSSVSELIDKDSKISAKKINESSKQIGKDIMSTMSNVLFFTYLCAGLPIFVLAIRNGYTIYNYITANFSLELTRFLVGSIGIIMTIPISTIVSIKMFKRGDV